MDQAGEHFATKKNIKHGDFAWLLANADYKFGSTLAKTVEQTGDLELIDIQ